MGIRDRVRRAALLKEYRNPVALGTLVPARFSMAMDAKVHYAALGIIDGASGLVGVSEGPYCGASVTRRGKQVSRAKVNCERCLEKAGSSAGRRRGFLRTFG